MADDPHVKGIEAGPIQNIRAQRKLNSDPSNAHFGPYPYGKRGNFADGQEFFELFLFFLCTRAK
jgi:hypothetical protein